MPSFTFPKREHLKSRKKIQALFRNGKAFSVYPYRIIFRISPTPIHSDNLQVGVTVPSRHFKRAVDRNRIKRQIRECFRLKKQSLIDFLAENEREIILFFIYTAKDLPDYSFLDKKMEVTLTLLMKKIASEMDRNEKNK